jgi:hypothetical protein
MELAQDWDKLHFEREHVLNIEPLRPDVIIIKNTPGVELHQKIAEIFALCKRVLRKISSIVKKQSKGRKPPLAVKNATCPI